MQQRSERYFLSVIERVKMSEFKSYETETHLFRLLVSFSFSFSFNCLLCLHLYPSTRTGAPESYANIISTSLTEAMKTL